MKAKEFIIEGVAGPKNCWPGYRKTGTQPGTGKNAGKRVNNCEKIKEDEVDESGLQYYTGVKKHGKEYMTKAAQAARDGASQKELGALKDKYSKAYKEESVEEAEKKGLYYYVNKRKKAGTSRDASSPKAPTAQAWKDAAKTAKKEGVAEGVAEGEGNKYGSQENWDSLRKDIRSQYPYKKGTTVTVPHKGKLVNGKIVRYEAGGGGYSPAYVVDIGEYESLMVEPNKVRRGVAEGVAEGLGKDIKRLATGKDVKSRAGQEIAKSQDASMKGDTKTSKKHFDRFDKLDKLANKEQGVAEGKEEYNRELNQKGFRFEQEINGVTYRVSNVKGGSDNIKIHALDKKQQVIGSASFWRHQYQDGLESLSTHVDPAWQGKGIATNMYAVMRMLGVNIHPATMQSDDGKKMWDKWRKSGDAKHIKSMNAKMTGVAEAGSPAQQAAIAINMKKHNKKPKNESLELEQEFDMIENIIESIADQHAIDAELVWEDLSTLTDDELYVFAVTSEMVNEDWQKANKRDKTDGMSQKAVNAYRRENPGSKLKTAVTTKPGKLKKGGKASKRRKSYCSRSRGQMKMHSISCAKTPDKAICKARRRWNC